MHSIIEVVDQEGPASIAGQGGAWGSSALPASLAGLLGAALLFGASLAPSLYPRPWLAHGLVSGASAALGYGFGTAAGTAARRLVRGRGVVRWRTLGTRVTVAVAVVVAVAALVWNARWRLDVHRLMDIEGNVALALLATTVVALVAGYLFVLLGRGARGAHRAYVRLVTRALPGRLQRALRVLLTLLVAFLVLNGFLLGRTVAAFDAMLVAADTSTDAAVEPPTSMYRAGSRVSMIPWGTLGSSGRAFVIQGPSVADLEAFSGRDARPPIRVYAGRRSAPTDAERARLAVAELDRTGAFEREVLVVITPTGSGSINPYTIDALEYLYNGDTAAVALQYGYLPSWVTMAGNQERAQRGSQALFEAVSERWRQEPAASRPKLLVYGESLGSFGSESNFTGIEDARARTDGVLWVGPTRGNRLWRSLVDARDPGSPVWQPVYEGGDAVRVGSDGSSLLAPGGEWPHPRVAYLQHATDPITWHTPGVFSERPEWLEEPRGPDISRLMPHIPVVTGLQVTVDMALAETAPLGHGHLFGPEQAEAWALVAPPEGWTPEDTARLVAHLSSR